MLWFCVVVVIVVDNVVVTCVDGDVYAVVLCCGCDCCR